MHVRFFAALVALFVVGPIALAGTHVGLLVSISDKEVVLLVKKDAKQKDGDNKTIKLAKDAKVGIAEARAIALKAHPGKITDEELEKEKGGSGLRYSFDIETAAGVQEVGVDAKTGAVLENAKEGKNPD